MINQLLGDSTLGGVPATGLVLSTLAKRTQMTDISASWVYDGHTPDSDIVFLVYVNGRLIQRLAGSVRQTDLSALNYNDQDIDIIPWRQSIPPPEEWYNGLPSSRAHLKWSRPTDTSIDHYKIYICDTVDGTYEVYGVHDKASLQRGYFPIGSSLFEVSGVYNMSDGYKNALFTVTVTDADAGLATCTNDVDSTEIPLVFNVGVTFIISGGIMGRFTGPVSDSDSVSFLVGVQPFYDTGDLEAGTHYFKVSTVDKAGNESALSDAIAIYVTPPPAPVASFELSYNESTDEIEFAGVQSPTANAAKVQIFTNWDQSTESYMPGVLFDVSFTEITAAADISFTGTLLDASGLTEGVLQVVARCLDSNNISDETAVLVSMDIPYIPANLPTPYALSAIPIVNGGVELTWLANMPAPFESPATVGAWEINGSITVTPEPAESDTFLKYTIILSAAQVGAEGSHTLSVRSVSASGFRYGASAEVTVTTDSTPPTALTTIIGSPF